MVTPDPGLVVPFLSSVSVCTVYCTPPSSSSMAGNWIVSAEINWSVGSIFLWTLEFLNFDINMHSIVTHKNIWRHCHKQANLIGCIFAIIMIIGCLLKCLLINIIMKMFYRSLPISMWWQLALGFDDFQSAILVLPLRRRSSPNILNLYLSQYCVKIEEPYWIAATWNCP